MIGETLRKEREKQRLTIQDIEEGTSIRASYIQAIESGEYNKMPGRVYVKGFIKNYANFLQLDGEDLVKQFLEEVAPASEVEEQDKDKNTGTSTDETDSESNFGEKISGFLSNISGNHLVAAIVLLAAFIGGFFYFQGGGTDVAGVDTSTKTKQEVQQPVSASTANESVIGAPVAAATPAQTNPQVDGVNVNATFTDDCWMLVTVDDVVVYEGVVTAGQVMDWKGNNNVNVRVGNAGAVDFVLNGQSLGKLGAEGDVVDKDFSR